MQAPRPQHALAQLWALADLPQQALEHIHLEGDDPILPSTFAVGSAAQASLAASALAAATLWQLRKGNWPAVQVDMRHAAIECRSERYLLVDGAPPPDPWDKLAGAYRCGDGRWVRLHTNFPHHRDGVLALLGCANERASVAEALLNWQAEAFETAASERGMVVAAMRSFAEWDAHPQAAVIAALPTFTLEQIGDAPVQALPPGDRPLSGIRVLDLSRVIAGPVCGRTLAAHGADVLMITSPRLPAIPSLVMDTGRGKRSAALDLTQAAEHAQLLQLLAHTDIFMQGYRPGGMNDMGLGPEALATLRPGLVYVSLSAYGHQGPWAHKRGFDSLVQTAMGFNHAESSIAGEAAPKPLPMQVLDHASGYLMALGAMAALHRRATVGGSWHVRVSLAQTAHWLRHLGRLPGGLQAPDISAAEAQPYCETAPSGFGQLTAVRHAGKLSGLPPHWSLPAVPLGHDPAAWW